jgi:hypothetical protein
MCSKPSSRTSIADACIEKLGGDSLAEMRALQDASTRHARRSAHAGGTHVFWA